MMKRVKVRLTKNNRMVTDGEVACARCGVRDHGLSRDVDENMLTDGDQNTSDIEEITEQLIYIN